MTRLFFRLWLILVLPLASVLAQTAKPEAASASVSSSAPPSDYLLQPNDLLRLKVFSEPDMLTEVRISQEYTVSLPLIKEVNLRNKTVGQAEQLIRELYDRDYLVNPQINLIVLEYARRTVNVLGMVNQPGAVQLPPEQKLTLLDAITRAGGFSPLANRKRVKLTRANGETSIVDADRLIEGGAREKSSLQVGDTIYVPERVL